MCQCGLKTVACVTEVQIACSSLVELVDQVLERKAVMFTPFPLLERARQRQQRTMQLCFMGRTGYSRIRRFVRFDISAMTCHSACVIVHDGAPVKNARAQCSQTATANAVGEPIAGRQILKSSTGNGTAIDDIQRRVGLTGLMPSSATIPCVSGGTR